MTPVLSLDAGIELLRQHADSIHNAELAALLHDVGKSTEYFRQLPNKPKHPRLFALHFALGRAKQLLAPVPDPLPLGSKPALEDIDRLEKEFSTSFRKWLNDLTIKLPAPLNDRTYLVSDLVEFYKVGSKQRLETFGTSAPLCFMLFLAHHNARGQEAHSVEKEDIETRTKSLVVGDNEPGLDLQTSAFKATVFGHEDPLPPPAASRYIHGSETKALTELLQLQTVDNKIPTNDILLSHIGHFAAAFFKALIAHVVLINAIPEEVAESEAKATWCLLRVAANGPAFWSNSERIPDIVARRAVFSSLLDFIRDGFEREWLIGNQIYRDDYGATFLLPGVCMLPEFQASLRARIRDRWTSFRHATVNSVEQAGSACDEFSFDLQFRGDFAVGPHGSYSFLLGELLEIPPPTVQPDSAQISLYWAQTPRAEVCSVCRLRPIGGTDKAVSRKLCHICEERRQDRSRIWLSNSTHTIWTDEVADSNGRIALVAARFRLENWVRQGGYIERTLRLGKDKKGTDHFKSPSFARIARVWDTTTEFWETGLRQIEASARVFSRVRLTGDFVRAGDVPVRGHAYFLRIPSGFRVSVVCASVGAAANRTQPAEFIVAENLTRASKLAGLPEESYRDTVVAGQTLASFLDGMSFSVEEPTGYGAADRTIGTFSGAAAPSPVATGDAEGYSPIIRILDDPTMIMFLAPAQSALGFAGALRKKYETEMTRVRDRLPMDLTVTYASSSNPVYALVDAARSMMNGLPRGSQEWQLTHDVETVDRHFLVRFKNGVAWNYPVYMGDGATLDQYYPFLLRNDSAVHVSKLKKGDVVKVEPSHFDFEFLDSSGRRFEIAYRDGKRRMNDVAQRPHLLDHIPVIGSLWNTLERGLETSQIRELDGILAAKRAEWGQEMPSDFAKWAVLTRTWNDNTTRSQKETVIDAAKSGLLHDVIEIHLGLERDRPR